MLLQMGSNLERAVVIQKLRHKITNQSIQWLYHRDVLRQFYDYANKQSCAYTDRN